MSKKPHLVLIGAHIRALREKRGQSQEAFAAEANFDRTYYAGIERGERNISALNLIKVAKAMNVEIGELFPPLQQFEE